MRKRGSAAIRMTCPGSKGRAVVMVNYGELAGNSSVVLLRAFVTQEGLVGGNGKELASAWSEQLYSMIDESLLVLYQAPLFYRDGPGSDVVERHNGRLADALSSWNGSRPSIEGGYNNMGVAINTMLTEGQCGVRDFWRCVELGADALCKINGIGAMSSQEIDTELARMARGEPAPPQAPLVQPILSSAVFI